MILNSPLKGVEICHVFGHVIYDLQVLYL
jgi:hypothetical protein